MTFLTPAIRLSLSEQPETISFFDRHCRTMAVHCSQNRKEFSSNYSSENGLIKRANRFPLSWPEVESQIDAISKVKPFRNVNVDRHIRWLLWLVQLARCVSRAEVID